MAAFDLLVIGAGPAAVATLMGADQGARICVVTGDAATPALRTGVHPKILTVASLRREAPGVTDPITLESSIPPAVSTATTGGLANYWGQQFLRYQPTDPWPRDAFSQYSEYLAACARVEAAFRITGGDDLRTDSLAPYRSQEPRLLVGTAAQPDAGLLAMRRTINQLSADRGVTTIRGRVQTLSANGSLQEALLSDGSTLSARQIVIAAGTLGTALLLLRSFPEIASIRLCDHAPWMLYTRGLNRLLRLQRRKGARHFNVLSLFRDDEEGPAFFGSVYNMRNAELSLILSTLTGRVFRGLGSLRAPWPAGMINPVQIWTNSTFAKVELGRDQQATRVLAAQTQDPELARFVESLRARGVFVLKTTRTPALQGYHFFGLEILTGGGATLSLTEFLARSNGGTLHCHDASSMRELGCRPPTLTSMARALAMTERLTRHCPR